MEENSIQEAIDAVKKVLTVHENHFFKVDIRVLNAVIERLEEMKKDGFK